MKGAGTPPDVGAGSAEPVLAAEGISKRFKIYPKPGGRLVEWLCCGRLRRHVEHWALRDLSFSVNAGETFGIMGRNGAGKTTLLSLLAGILSPTMGVIRRPHRVATLINLGAGFDPDSSGAENLRRIGDLLDGSPMSPEEIAEAIAFSELGDDIHRPFKTYSSGMQMRLGFAAATQRRPDLLIIDEVMAVGDFFFRRKCHQRIASFVTCGTAAILVSHDYSEITQFCRRALVLDRGTISFLGNASSAVNHYLLGRNDHKSPTHQAQAQPTIRSEHSSTQIAWPSPDQQMRVRPDSISTIRDIRILRIACCDTTLTQRHVYEQGQQCRIFVEIEALSDINVPVVTVQISDDRGALIHGTSTYMSNDQTHQTLQARSRMQVSFAIGLALRYGEYQLDIAFGDIPAGTFSHRHRLTFEAFGQSVRQLGRLEKMAVIAVVPRQGGTPTQLTHHGLCDLPRETTISISGPPASPHPEQAISAPAIPAATARCSAEASPT